jgi:hypothetical protein
MGGKSVKLLDALIEQRIEAAIARGEFDGSLEAAVESVFGGQQALLGPHEHCSVIAQRIAERIKERRAALSHGEA